MKFAASIRGLQARNACCYRAFFPTALLLVLAAFSAALRGAPPEYLAAEQPVPASVEDELSPMEEAYEIDRPPPPAFPELRDPLETAAPFWRDTRLLLHPRVYSFDRYRENANDSVALAYGGWLAYSSGWWRERLKLNATLYTTQRAYGPEHKDGTLLLKEGQRGFTVLGEANAELKLTEDFSLKLYRQSFNLPYLNRNDSRMIPNTFEAYTLNKNPSNGWALTLAQVERIKLRDSDSFLSMSEAAGFDNTNEPLTAAAFLYNFSDDIDFGVTSQYAWEFMNTVYAEANAVWRFDNDWALRLSGQYTDQRSVGDELGGDFKTSVFGAKLAGSYKGATLSAAFSSTGSGAGIRNPFGGYPGYLSLMIKGFNRADEDAWLAGASYDFARVGIPGLSGFVNYARGTTPDSGRNASPDQSELDITLDYRFQSGILERLWVRARAAFVDQKDNVVGFSNVRDYRIILNYDLPIF